MLGFALGTVQLAGVFKLSVEEAVGNVATRATVIVIKPSLNAVAPVSRGARLTARSNVNIIRTNKR